MTIREAHYGSIRRKPGLIDVCTRTERHFSVVNSGGRSLARPVITTPEGHRLPANVRPLQGGNDTPNSKPLHPLLVGTNLKDAFTHPSFDDGGFPGTYGSCGADNKIDYLLLSPNLTKRVNRGGVLRRGMWPGVRPKRWDVYDQVKEKSDAAADHAAVWVDIDS
jgi:hypothetical protein